MTTARLKPAIADGHGLTHGLVDQVYRDLSAGKPVTPIVALVVLEPVEHGEKKTAAGTTRLVRWEATQLEPLRDQHEIDDARWRLQKAWDSRHTPTTMPLDFDGRTADEQRRFLLGLVEDDWAHEQGLTATDVKERWQTFWGIESDAVPADGAFPHPDYKQAAAHHLREFALNVGVLADDKATDGQVAGDAAATLPETQPDDPTCQVCSAMGVRLTDGLCDGCAKSAGIPVPGGTVTELAPKKRAGHKA